MSSTITNGNTCIVTGGGNTVTTSAGTDKHTVFRKYGGTIGTGVSLTTDGDRQLTRGIGFITHGNGTVSGGFAIAANGNGIVNQTAIGCTDRLGIITNGNSIAALSISESALCQSRAVTLSIYLAGDGVSRSRAASSNAAVSDGHIAESISLGGCTQRNRLSGFGLSINTHCNGIVT